MRITQTGDIKNDYPPNFNQSDYLRTKMRKFAVAHADFFNNDLVIEIIEAPDPTEAIKKHSAFNEDGYAEETQNWLEGCLKEVNLDNKEEMKTFFFDMDILVDVVEL